MTDQRPRPIERFTDHAKRVLAIGGSEAIRLSHTTVEPEHVLLGLVADGTLRAHVPQLAALDLDQARVVVESLTGRGSAQEQPEGIAPSAETRKIIELAVDEADALGAERVDPKHVLLGVTRYAGQTRAVLEAFGVSAEMVRSQILEAGR
jgi:ATP-dependent Clp protease ATP-binding subunit ClpA